MKQHDELRAAYMATFTLEQGQSHNRIHEALLINGYECDFIPECIEDDGDGETGPMPRVEAAYFMYQSDREYVFTTFGVVQHRVLRDLEQEKYQQCGS